MSTLPILVALLLLPGSSPQEPAGGPALTRHGLPLLAIGYPVTALAPCSDDTQVVVLYPRPGSRLLGGRILDLETGATIAEFPGPHRLEVFRTSAPTLRVVTGLLSSLVPDEGSGRVPAAGVGLAPFRPPFATLILGLPAFQNRPLPDRLFVVAPPLSDPDTVSLHRFPPLSFEGRLAVIDAVSGRHLRQLPAGPPPLAVTLSLDARLVAVSHDVESGTTLRILDGTSGVELLALNPGPARSLEFSADGARLLLTGFGRGGPRRGAILLDASSGKPVWRRDHIFRSGPASSGLSLADGAIYVAGGGREEDGVVEIDPATGASLRSLEVARSGALTCLAAVARTRTILAAGEDGVIHRVALASREEVPGHRSPVAAVAYLPDPDGRLASIDVLGTLIVWGAGGEVDLRRDLSVETPDPILAPDFARGRELPRIHALPRDEGPPTLLIAPLGAGSLHAYCPHPTEKEIRLVRRRIEPLLTPSCMDARGDLVALGDARGGLLLLPLGPGDPVYLPEVHRDPVLAVRLTPPPVRLLSASASRWSARRIAGDSGPMRPLFSRELRPGIQAVEMSPRGETLVIAFRSPPGPGGDTGQSLLETLDVATGTVRGRSSPLPHVLALESSPTGEILAVATPGAIRLHRGDLSLIGIRAAGLTTCLTFSSSGRRLAVGLIDGTILETTVP